MKDHRLLRRCLWWVGFLILGTLDVVAWCDATAPAFDVLTSFLERFPWPADTTGLAPVDAASAQTAIGMQRLLFIIVVALGCWIADAAFALFDSGTLDSTETGWWPRWRIVFVAVATIAVLLLAVPVTFVVALLATWNLGAVSVPAG